MDTRQGTGQDLRDFNQEVQAIWNQNADFWDEKMADEGNDFQRILVGPGVFYIQDISLPLMSGTIY